MKCPNCSHGLRKIKVKIQDANTPVDSYQCKECGYFSFEEKSINKAIEEIKVKEAPLQMKQKIIKLSQNRLGIYWNKDIVRSLNLKAGEEVDISVPNKKQIVIGLRNN